MADCYFNYSTCKRSCRYLRGLQDEVVDNDLLLVGQAESVLANECDSEGDAVHGLFPARPVNKFILSLQGIDRGLLRRHLLPFNQIKKTNEQKMQKKDCFPGGGATYQTLVVRQHDDYLSVVVPDHPPKVCGGVWQRMLGNDKLVTPEVTLKEHKVGIRSLAPKDV